MKATARRATAPGTRYALAGAVLAAAILASCGTAGKRGAWNVCVSPHAKNAGS